MASQYLTLLFPASVHQTREDGRRTTVLSDWDKKAPLTSALAVDLPSSAKNLAPGLSPVEQMRADEPPDVGAGTTSSSRDKPLAGSWGLGVLVHDP
ncbi:hypothetical protein QQS21_007601 [Conoideocrella luteorostrata]|uniref:Uncharacterized protein n=1 Tax=Conoideocrella luteorostrata TaxID=1105319 RepID=A0AAJ0CL92_9HYPO|nr:hypothetical protein QQS21_007601 [Conoideocrella luteorostrata]